LVRNAAEEPAPDRAHQEACAEHARRVQELRGLIPGRKELRGKIKGRERVDVEVVPLHQISRRTADDRPDPAPGVALADAMMSVRNGSHLFFSSLAGLVWLIVRV